MIVSCCELNFLKFSLVGFNDAFNTIRLYKRQGYGTQLVLINAGFNQFEEKDKF